MINKGRILPKDVIDHWPEIFEGVTLNVVPLRYLHSIVINFKDKTAWDIKVTPDLRKGGWDSLQELLSELVENYEHVITDIDFQLDIDRIKKDIKRKTSQFLKKKKLQ